MGLILEITESEYGFISIRGEDESGKFPRTKAITNIAWNKETRQFYDENAPKGMVFRNMNSLFGRPIVEERVLIANDVKNDARAGGRPDGHPPLNSFAGIPIRDEAGMVGLVGVANRKAGHSEQDVADLQPIIAFLSSVLRNLELEARAESASRELNALQALQAKVLGSSSSGFVVVEEDGTLALINSQAEKLLGLNREAMKLEDARLIAQRLTDFFFEGESLRDILLFVESPDRLELGPLEMVSQLSDFGALPDIELTATWIGEDARTFPLLLTVNDLKQRQVLAQSLRLNSHLEARVKQLAETQQHNETISECVEYLQTCTSLTEGLQLVSRFIQRFYSDALDSQLYGSMSSDSSVLRTLSPTDDSAASERHPHECWALRSRRVYCS